MSKRILLAIFATFLSVSVFADAVVIDANGLGAYVYEGKLYHTDNFPVEKVAKGNKVVRIVAVDNIPMNEVPGAVGPLAKRFQDLNIKVETIFQGEIIPFYVK